MTKSYIYYVSYAGSKDTCFEIHKGKVILPEPIETDDHIKRVEEMIYKKTGHRPAALLGFSLLRTQDVECEANFYDGERVERLCT